MVDLALMDQNPGELLPESPTADTAAVESGAETETKSGTGEMTVDEEPTEAETTDQAAGDIEAEAEQPVISETGTAADPESVAQAELVSEANTAEPEAVAQLAPAPTSQPKETGDAVVLSSGGNVGSTGGFTSLQIMLMSASVIWGFVGTALYFSSKKTQEHGHDHHH
jgi:hypothetical protein